MRIQTTPLGVAAWLLLAALITLLLSLRVPTPLSDWNFTHWLFNYEEEFVKRGLLGESLRLAGLPTEYAFISALSTAILVVLCAALVVTFSTPLRRHPKLYALSGFFLLAISHPATLQHFRFDLGRFDGVTLLLTLFSLYIIARHRYWLASIIVPGVLAMVVLVHEAALFMFLPMVMAFWLHKYGIVRRELIYVGLVTLTLTLFTYSISTNGLASTYGLDEHLTVMQSKHGDKVVRSSLNVLHYGSVSENLTRTQENALTRARLYQHIGMLLVLAPLLLLLWPLVRTFGRTERLLLFSAFAPLLLYPLGHDHFRWWALALTNLFIVVSLVCAIRPTAAAQLAEICDRQRGLITTLILLGVAVGPLGVTGNFPLSLI